MAIKDGRILIADGSETLEGATPTWEQTGLGGGSQLQYDTQTVYEGSQSVVFTIDNSEGYVYFDTGTTNDWSNNEFYFLIQFGVIGDMVAAGMRFRFTGSNVNNWFEFQAATATTWPAYSVGGGWYHFVVDIEGTPTNTGGTPPATSSIQRCGVVLEIATMAKQDNTWIDAIYRRPYSSPGLIIEGNNGGDAYNWADVLTQAQTDDLAIFTEGPGGSYVVSTPIQIGNTTTGQSHEFDDNNALILWDDQPLSNANAYQIEFVNTPGSTLNVVAGEKSGTGSSAVGTQGWTISAASSANRWNMIANNSLANVNLYGCSLSHSDVISVQSSNVEVISTFLIDGAEYIHSTTAGTSKFINNTVISANTVDNEAYVKSVDVDEIVSSTFNFLDGHAIEITDLSSFPASTNTFSLSSDIFTNYSTANNDPDSTIFNNSGRAITLNITGGTVPTVREGVGADTEIVASVDVEFNNIIDDSEVRLYEFTGEVVGAEQSGGDEDLTGGSITFSVAPGTDFLLKVVLPSYNIVRVQFNSGSDGFTGTSARRIEQTIDRVYSNPS